MERYNDAPQVLRDFLSYHETIKGQSKRTIAEYYLDLRMFLRFLKLVRNELPYNTPLDDIPIKDVDAAFLASVRTSEIFDFLAYLANDRENPESDEAGISTASRARKLSAIKSLYKYLTVSTKQITENPVKDIEFPKIRKSLPKYGGVHCPAARGRRAKSGTRFCNSDAVSELRHPAFRARGAESDGCL